ncbi:MAG TPA: phosphate acyltransferase PlsX [Flavipsychrobacter sp.]|nr:phosphate acyltransferase PlsX [Flavipsychrobacter sp.]
MKIALDIMGGDYAPLEAIKGVKKFFEEDPNEYGVHLLLIGNMQAVADQLPMIEAYKEHFTLIDTPEMIDMHEHPTKALKEKPNSSIALGFGLLAQGKADAFMSAGNTGAMMVGSMYSVKTIDGILRPTIISPIPRPDGSYNLLVDAGANADCKPEHLVQFAELGSLYMNRVLGLDNPKVGLLNLGHEEGKGNLLCQATYPLLKELKTINFIGNIEGRDMFLNKADVVVCEGFVGNVTLKMAESIYNIFTDRGIQDDFLYHFNPEIYGGTPILGINKPVIIAHGISHAMAFDNMIKVAAKTIQSELISAFKAHFAAAPTAS